MKYKDSEGQRSASFGTVGHFSEQARSQISVKVFS